MVPAEDEDVVEAFVSDAAHPPFGDRVRLWRPHRRLDHTHTLAAHDLVERAGELGVTIVQQVAQVPLLDREIARLLGDPAKVRVGGDTRQVNPPRPCSMKNNTYSVRSQAVSTVKKSHATIPCA